MRACPKEPGGSVGRASRLQLAQSQKVLLGSAVHAAHCPELPSAPHSRHHRCSVSTIIGVWSELLGTCKVLRTSATLGQVRLDLTECIHMPLGQNPRP